MNIFTNVPCDLSEKTNQGHTLTSWVVYNTTLGIAKKTVKTVTQVDISDRFGLDSTTALIVFVTVFTVLNSTVTVFTVWA